MLKIKKIVESKMMIKPLFPLRLGPDAGFTIKPEDKEWSGLPPGNYKSKFEPHEPPSGKYVLIFEKQDDNEV